MGGKPETTGVLLTFKILPPHSEGDCGHPHTQRPSRGALQEPGQAARPGSLPPLIGAQLSPAGFSSSQMSLRSRGEINTSLGRAFIRPPNEAAPHRTARPPSALGNGSLSPQILQAPPSRSLSSPGTPSTHLTSSSPAQSPLSRWAH